jgi:predicted nucleic acid-binding protein
MTILLDTNILMDALQERQPFDIEAKEILKRSQNGELICLFTANAVTDIFYLYSKARGIKSARAAIGFLLGTYGVIDVTHADCLNALNIPVEDYEDALAVECAKKAGVDFIVSRDAAFLRSRSPVEIISPRDLITKLNQIQETP